MTYSHLLVCALAITPSTLAQQIFYSATDPASTYSPAGAWGSASLPGSYDRKSMFNEDSGSCTFKFPIASPTFQFWGYTSGGAGKYNISIDGGAASTVSYVGNNGTPGLIFNKTGLTNTKHTVTITNIPDTVAGGAFGVASVDHFVLTGAYPKPVPPTFPSGSVLNEVNMVDGAGMYHVPLSLGKDAKTNGGSGAALNVLFDTGASAPWATWVGCTSSDCLAHNRYSPSKTHFHNTSTTDLIAYGDGQDIVRYWIVDDTVQFGNLSITQTEFGAAYQLDPGEPNDGNFGMAKSYCGGVQCPEVQHPNNLVETLFSNKQISAPVLSFYQLGSGLSPPAGVSSVAAIGALDRNKYTGSMDWLPIAQGDSWFMVSNFQTIIIAAGPPTEITSQLRSHQMIFDTGDGQLLGVPSDDWQTLLRAVGARADGWFPCSAVMQWAFHGTQNGVYTIDITDTRTDDGSGFCSPVVYDSNDLGNWITGAPFLSRYFLAFYYGVNGTGSTIGLGQMNTDASAAKSAPVIGAA